MEISGVSILLCATVPRLFLLQVHQSGCFYAAANQGLCSLCYLPFMQLELLHA